MKYKNKYLKGIGYKNSCSENVVYGMKGDKRRKRWKKQRKKCGNWDSRCTWNLNTFMVEQIYTWLKMYMEYAEGYIDLTYHKFKIDEVEMNQKECVSMAISKIEYWLTHYEDADIETINNRQRCIEQAFQIISKILPALWW